MTSDTARPLAIKGARFYPVAGKPLDGGVMLVEGGKITYLGPEGSCPGGGIPATAEVIDATGKHVTPGFIDCHCHVGIIPEELDWQYGDVNETTNVVTAHVRAIDGIDFDEPGFGEALEGGVTACIIHPGSANVIGGLDIAVKTGGPGPAERIIRNPAGVKMAWSTHGKSGRFRSSGLPYPTTRMGTAAILRQMLQETKDYLEAQATAAGGTDGKAAAGKGGAPAVDAAKRLTYEALALVLRREVPARIHSMTPVDILAIMRLQDEFGFDFTVDHGDEAHLIAAELARRGVPVNYGPFVGDRRGFFERAVPAAAKILADAGVVVGLQTDHPVISLRDLRLQAALLVRYGLDETRALEMLTINPARIMGAGDRLGALAAGRDADFTVWSGPPLSVMSRAEQVFIDGRRIR